MGVGKEFFDLINTVGYDFCDITHLQTALTHSSYSNEMKRKGFRAVSNEAYEFLGDAVLELFISEALFDKCAKDGEGALTKHRQSLVCESTLAKIAASIRLGDYLNVGTSEENTDLRSRPKVLADAFEALIASMYIDAKSSGRMEACKSAVLSLFDTEITSVISSGNTDYKSMLQQFVEKNAGTELRYEYSESGPEHKKSFAVRAYINNNPVGDGVGKTKRSAEMQAAKKALTLFGILT